MQRQLHQEPREVHCFCKTSHCGAVGTTRVINVSKCLRSLGVMQSSSHVAKSCAVSCNICDKNVKYGPGRAKRGTIQLLEYQIPLFSVTSSPSSPSPKSPLASCCCSSTCSPRWAATFTQFWSVWFTWDFDYGDLCGHSTNTKGQGQGQGSIYHYLMHCCVGHTAWATEGRKGRSQGDPQGRQLDF